MEEKKKIKCNNVFLADEHLELIVHDGQVILGILRVIPGVLQAVSTVR